MLWSGIKGGVSGLISGLLAVIASAIGAVCGFIIKMEASILAWVIKIPLSEILFWITDGHGQGISWIYFLWWASF